MQESHDSVAKQLLRDQETKVIAELTEQVKTLQEQVKQLQVVRETQPVTAVHSELSAEKLYQQVRKLERENGKLQEQVKKLEAELADSKRSRQG